MAASKGNPTNPTDRVLEKRVPRGSKDSALPPRVPVFVLVAGALFAVIFAIATVFRVLPTPLYLLLGLSFSTAVIAYWSDQLGMKLGKKRISLFGLRPRQTATLISIGSSWLIMLFSVAVLLLIYAPLRGALLRYDDTKADNKTLETKNKTLEKDIAAQQKNVETRAQQNTVLSRKIGQQNRSLQTLSAEIGVRQTDLTRAKVNLQVSETARDRAKTAQEAALKARNEAENAKRNAENARQNAESGQAQAKRGEETARVRTAQAQVRLVQAQTRYSQAQTRFLAAQAKVERAESEVRRVENRLTSTRSSLITARNNLSSVRLQYRQLKTQKDQAELDKTQAELDKTQAESSRTQAIEELKNAIKAKVAVQQQSKEIQRALIATQAQLDIANTLISDPTKIVVNAGQVFASATLPASLDVASAREDLTRLISQGRKNVIRDGWQSLYLLPLPVGEEENEIALALANYISTFDVPVSVRLVAARSHIEGETEIVARLLAYPVKQAFASGEVLAQTTIEVPASGASGDAQIFNQLLRLVDRGGKNEAQKRGVVPLITVETPNFFAPDTNLRIFEAMRELQSLGAGRRATVKLVAADAISTVESPRVRFEVS